MLLTCFSIGCSYVEGVSLKAHSLDEFELHNDFGYVNIVGMYCEESDSEGGESYILSCKDVLKELSKEEINLLSQIQVRVPPICEGSAVTTRPLLEINNGKAEFYYTNWFVERPLDPALMNALSKFESLLTFDNPNAFKHRLEKTMFIIFNNKDIWHGRSSLPSNSKRLLKRIWI